MNGKLKLSKYMGFFSVGQNQNLHVPVVLSFSLSADIGDSLSKKCMKRPREQLLIQAFQTISGQRDIDQNIYTELHNVADMAYISGSDPLRQEFVIFKESKFPPLAKIFVFFFR